MKKQIFEGWLFNRLEKINGQVFNHIGFEGKEKDFIDFLSQFVPEIGTRRKVSLIIKAEDEIEEREDYKIAKDYLNNKK
jgi:hypothetical protein